MPRQTPHDIGTRIGRAIARDVLAEDMPREWTGLDAQDGDQLLSAGITDGTPEWDEAEAAARAAYRLALAPVIAGMPAVRAARLVVVAVRSDRT